MKQEVQNHIFPFSYVHIYVENTEIRVYNQKYVFYGQKTKIKCFFISLVIKFQLKEQ